MNIACAPIPAGMPHRRLCMAWQRFVTEDTSNSILFRQACCKDSNRKLKATFNEEDDDNKSLRLKKEKDQNGQYLSVNNAPAHSLIACSGRSLPLTHLSYRKCYSPSCKMHVLFQVFRI